MIFLLAQAVAEEGQLGPDDQSTLGDIYPSRGGPENFPKMGKGGQFSPMDSVKNTRPSGGYENFSNMNIDDGEHSQSRMETFSSGRHFSLGSGKASGLITPRWE